MGFFKTPSSKKEAQHRLPEADRGNWEQARLQEEEEDNKTQHPHCARVLPSCVRLPSRSRARTRSRRPVDRAVQFLCLPLSSSRRPCRRRAPLRRPPLSAALASRLADLQEQRAIHPCLHPRRLRRRHGRAGPRGGEARWRALLALRSRSPSPAPPSRPSTAPCTSRQRDRSCSGSGSTRQTVSRLQRCAPRCRVLARAHRPRIAVTKRRNAPRVVSIAPCSLARVTGQAALAYNGSCSSLAGDHGAARPISAPTRSSPRRTRGSLDFPISGSRTNPCGGARGITL